MAKRRTKKRTHVPENSEEASKIPKSMVIRVGQTSMANHSLNQLVKDFRHIMEPYTALKLKERKSNKLKDFVVMCGPLSVSHLFIFTQSERTGNISLKVARTPHGPTITFQVEDFSLNKDIKRYLKRPKSLNKEDVLDPPLMVLNGFNSFKSDGKPKDDEANVEKVVVSMFQNVFPPLNPSKTQLNSIKRVFMINKDAETGEISLRHYFIDINEVDISKNLKYLYKAKNNLHKAVPNLHRKEDISSLVLDHDVNAYTSESEVEDEAVVKMFEKRNVRVGAPEPALDQQPQEQPASRKKAVKLTELGPRINMKLVKIEEGICSGRVLHHEYVQKTDAEIKDLIKRHEQKKKLKEQRKKEQEENVSRKKAVKDAKKKRKMERRQQRREQGVKESDGNESSSEEEASSSGEAQGDISEDSENEIFSEQE